MTNNTGKGFVLYDGSYGFCSWWIPFWKKTINKTGFGIAPLQAKCLPAKASAQAGVKEIHLTNEFLNKDIVLLLKSGERLIGADVYIFGMNTVWWSSPVGYILGFRGFRQLT